ncbi:MAG: DUF3137 domain-containing protein [Akkermansiaceae bacterium]
MNNDSNAHPLSLLQKIEPLLNQIEQARMTSVSQLSTGKKHIVGAVLFLILSVVVTVQFSAAALGIIAALIYCIVIYVKYFRGHKKQYCHLYKAKVISSITEALQPKIRYSPYQGVSLAQFKSTKLHPTRIDRYTSEDLFEGKIGSTAIMFSEAHALQKHTTTDSKGNTQTKWTTIFKGVIAIIDFNKEFNSWLTVKPDFAEKNLGWLGRKMQGMSSHLVRLESPEFEQAFVVHAGDQVEARYLLTPDMQERLLQLRKTFGKDIRMSFLNSSLHLALPNSKNLFEPDIYKSAHDSHEISKFVHQMSSIFEIVENLDLNTRIWTKE